MAFWMSSAVGLAVVNLGLLLVVGTVWLRNYRTFRTNLLLGLLLFAGVLAMENLVAIGAYLSTEMVYAGGKTAMYAIVGLRAMQFLALAFLAVVTLFPSGSVLRSIRERPSGEQR
jgi:heme exporter protein D